MAETLIVEAVNKYMAIGIGAVLVACAIWLIKYYVKEQSKNMKTVLDLFKNELKDLHKDSSINTKLNQESVKMIEILTDRFTALTEYLNRHFNGCVDKVNYKKKVKKE